MKCQIDCASYGPQRFYGLSYRGVINEIDVNKILCVWKCDVHVYVYISDVMGLPIVSGLDRVDA